MAVTKWKQVSAFDNSVDRTKVRFIKPKNLSKGEQIEGVYLGSYTDAHGKKMHRISASDGTVLVVGGANRLDRLMEKVDRDSLVRLTYKGKEYLNFKRQNGEAISTQAHKFIVEVAE